MFLRIQIFTQTHTHTHTHILVSVSLWARKCTCIWDSRCHPTFMNLRSYLQCYVNVCECECVSVCVCTWCVFPSLSVSTPSLTLALWGASLADRQADRVHERLRWEKSFSPSSSPPLSLSLSLSLALALSLSRALLLLQQLCTTSVMISQCDLFAYGNIKILWLISRKLKW